MWRRIGVAFAVIVGAATPALAQIEPGAASSIGSRIAGSASSSSVTVKLTQVKVVKAADGTETLVDAASVKPDDVIEYRAVYTNVSAKPVTQLTANLPIPDGLEYLPGSTIPASARAATKGGVFAAQPLMHLVAGRSVPLPYNEYRALRWTFAKLPAGGGVTVVARAKVEKALPHQIKIPSGVPPATTVH